MRSLNCCASFAKLLCQIAKLRGQIVKLQGQIAKLLCQFGKNIWQFSVAAAKFFRPDPRVLQEPGDLNLLQLATPNAQAGSFAHPLGAESCREVKAHLPVWGLYPVLGLMSG